MKFRHLVFFLSLLPLHAEEPPNLFKKTQDLPKDNQDLPMVAMSSLWYIEVPQARSEEDEFPSFKKALAWVKEGRAQIFECSYHCGHPGQESYSMSGAELRSPVEYSSPVFSDEWFTPVTFDTKNLGYTFETNVNSSENNLIQARISASYRKELDHNFYHELMSSTFIEGDLSMPRFQRQNFDSGILSPSGQTRLITSFSKNGDPTRTIHLYHTATITTLAPLADGQSFKKDISLKLKILSVSSEDWVAYSQNSDLNELRTQTVDWVTNVKFSILQEETFTLTTGKKSDFHLGKKHIYPTEFSRPKRKIPLSKSNPILVSERDTKHLGLTFRTTPSHTKTGHLLLPYDFHLIEHVDERVVHRIKSKNQWEISATTPFFTVVNSKGGTFLSPSSETLLAVHAAMRENGTPDPSKRLLVFAEAH